LPVGRRPDFHFHHTHSRKSLTRDRSEFTNLWRLWRVTRGSIHTELIDLHKRYGPVVRVGPNIINVDYPELIKTVFSTKGDWKKVRT